MSDIMMVCQKNIFRIFISPFYNSKFFQIKPESVAGYHELLETYKYIYI